MSLADFVKETIGTLYTVDLDIVRLDLLFESLLFFKDWIYEVG